jgi:hypothetical protein
VVTSGAFIYTPTPVETLSETVNPSVVTPLAIQPTPIETTSQTLDPWIIDRSLTSQALTLRSRSNVLTLPNREPGELAADRLPLEYIQEQGSNESRNYVISTANWTGTPSGASVQLKRMRAGGTTVDASNLLSGSVSASATSVTTPLITGLAAGKSYQLEVKFNFSGRTIEVRVLIRCFGASRYVVQSPTLQGEDERSLYVINCEAWTATPSSPTARLYLVKGNGLLADMTASKLLGSASASGKFVLTPEVYGLVRGKRYVLATRFTISGRIEECLLDIYGRE